jgi:hypothetical protein
MNRKPMSPLRPILRAHLHYRPGVTATAACAAPDSPAIVPTAASREATARDWGFSALKAWFYPVYRTYAAWFFGPSRPALAVFGTFTKEITIACLRFEQ